MSAAVVSLARLQHLQRGTFVVGPLGKRPTWSQGSEVALHLAVDKAGRPMSVSFWDGFTWKDVDLSSSNA